MNIRKLAIIKDSLYGDQLEAFFKKIDEPFVPVDGKITNNSQDFPYIVWNEQEGWKGFTTGFFSEDVITIPALISTYAEKSKKTVEELKIVINKSSQPLNLVYQWVKDDSVTYKEFTLLLSYIEEIKDFDYKMDGFR